MAHYLAFIDGMAGAYGATFPDVPGCTAMGATTDEVIRNAIEALREWVADRVGDGFPVPEARSYDAIASDSSSGWKTAYAQMLIPLLLDTGRSVQANISFDAGLLRAIDDAADRRGLTRSAFLASAARDKIAAEG